MNMSILRRYHHGAKTGKLGGLLACPRCMLSMPDVSIGVVDRKLGREWAISRVARRGNGAVAQYFYPTNRDKHSLLAARPLDQRNFGPRDQSRRPSHVVEPCIIRSGHVDLDGGRRRHGRAVLLLITTVVFQPLSRRRDHCH